METVGQRIEILIKDKKLTQTKVAEMLNLSQSHISALCSGKKVLGNRTASDICREFGVSRSWLLYGEGEMFVQRTENEELAMLFADLLQEVDGSFRKRFVSAILSYPVDKLAVLEEFISSLLPKEENNKAEDE